MIAAWVGRFADRLLSALVPGVGAWAAWCPGNAEPRFCGCYGSRASYQPCSVHEGRVTCDKECSCITVC